MPATVVHLCVSETKGSPKRPVDRVRMLADHGIEGDAHAGPGHRQISLLDTAEIEAFRPANVQLPAGIFAENIATGGLDLAALGIGTRLRLGDVELEITQVGKVCHSRCAVYERIGDCIMPREGIFARIIKGGFVKPGQAVYLEDS